VEEIYYGKKEEENIPITSSCVKIPFSSPRSTSRLCCFALSGSPKRLKDKTLPYEVFDRRLFSRRN